MQTRENIVELVYQAVGEVNEDLDLMDNRKLNTDAKTVLYGPWATIDSMTLVSFIVAIEENIRRRLGLSVTLANEKAMSMERSPFRTLDSLIDFVVSTVGEAQP
jgi:hypothetical protein